MFEGNKSCGVCSRELKKNERNFGISLGGYTYVFCDQCMQGKKDQITAMLHK